MAPPSIFLNFFNPGPLPRPRMAPPLHPPPYRNSHTGSKPRAPPSAASSLPRTFPALRPSPMHFPRRQHELLFLFHKEFAANGTGFLLRTMHRRSATDRRNHCVAGNAGTIVSAKPCKNLKHNRMPLPDTNGKSFLIVRKDARFLRRLPGHPHDVLT